MIDQTFHLEPGVGMINDVSVGAQLRLVELLSAATGGAAAHGPATTC